MQKIRSNLLGIEQGSETLFDDFATEGEMWAGQGQRRVYVPIRFDEPFRAPPVVHVALSMWDISSKANARVEVKAQNVRCQGFEIVFTTWKDSKIARARADWMAIGEVPDEDDWDV